MTGYEPELGQMLFGTAWGQYECPEVVTDLLRALTLFVNGDGDVHIYEEFANDMFTIRPYWWGECTCGYAEQEAEWDEDNEHRNGCPALLDALQRCKCGYNDRWEQWVSEHRLRRTWDVHERSTVGRAVDGTVLKMFAIFGV